MKNIMLNLTFEFRRTGKNKKEITINICQEVYRDVVISSFYFDILIFDQSAGSIYILGFRLYLFETVKKTFVSSQQLVKENYVKYIYCESVKTDKSLFYICRVVFIFFGMVALKGNFA